MPVVVPFNGSNMAGEDFFNEMFDVLYYSLIIIRKV